MTNWHLTTDGFDLFLQWLHPNRDEAGRKYEALRRRLLGYFELRGCTQAEELTDETINIVIRKSPTLLGTYQGEPAPYFYAVAHNLLQKHFSQRAKFPAETLNERLPATGEDAALRKEIEDRCLQSCLQKLAYADRQLVCDYYQSDARSKIEQHKHLAQKMGLSEGALRTRMSRLRQRLRECVLACCDREDHQHLNLNKL